MLRILWRKLWSRFLFRWTEVYRSWLLLMAPRRHPMAARLSTRRAGLAELPTGLPILHRRRQQLLSLNRRRLSLPVPEPVAEPTSILLSLVT